MIKQKIFGHCHYRQFYFSEDGDRFQEAGPVLDASILSDDHGEHWGFTGSFVALACQDLSGTGLPAEYDFLEITQSTTSPANDVRDKT